MRLSESSAATIFWILVFSVTTIAVSLAILLVASVLDAVGLIDIPLNVFSCGC